MLAASGLILFGFSKLHRSSPSEKVTTAGASSDYVQGGKLDSRSMTKGIEDGINQTSSSKLNDDPYNPITMRKKSEEAYRKNTQDLDALKAQMPSNSDINKQVNVFISKYQELYTPKDFIKQLFQNVDSVRVAKDFPSSNLLYEILSANTIPIDVSIACDKIILSGRERYSGKNIKVKLATKDIDNLEIFSYTGGSEIGGKYIPCKKSLKCAYLDSPNGNKEGNGLALYFIPGSNDSIYSDEWFKLHNDKSYNPSRLSNFHFSEQLQLLESKRLQGNSSSAPEPGPYTF